MSATTIITSTEREPCALRYYLRQRNTKPPSYVLSHGECQVAFQHWVAYVRGHDDGNTSEFTAKEHLTCPLLWCRKSFDNLTSTLNHIDKCPWLSNTWYWCPSCCRPESFLAFDEPCINPRQCVIQRRDSKLRRAMTFFKHIGFKSCSRHETLKSSATSEPESFDMWFTMRYAGKQEPELEDTSLEISTRAELEDSSNGAHGHGSYVGQRAESVYEMEDTMIDISQYPDYLSHNTQEARSTTRPCELDVDPLITNSQSKTNVASHANPFTKIRAQFRAGSDNIKPGGDMCVSSTLTLEGLFNHQSAEPMTSPCSELDTSSPAYNGSNTISLPANLDHHWCHDNVAPPLRGPLPSEHNKACDGMPLSAQSQIEDLRETVGMLNKEWLRRCQPTPDLFLRASVLSPQSLSSKGAQTLQLIFQGGLPGTFDEIFALVHFACAASYIVRVHRDNSSHCWSQLFQDMFNLHILIENESDARLFSQLVNLLSWSQWSSTQHSCGNGFLDNSSGTFVPLRRPVTDLDGLSSTKQASMILFKSLKCSAVIQECSRFLDGFEYAGILERNVNPLTPLSRYAQNRLTSTDEILRKIIHPLQQCHGIEALRDAVNHTAMEWSSGSLCSVREVEVSLISNGQSSCLSPKVYKRYIDTVTSLCDQMIGSASNWRDKCYALHLDLVLASFEQMEKQRGLDLIPIRRRHCTNVNSMPDNLQPLPENTPTQPSTVNQTLISSSLSAVTSPTFTGENHTSPESSFSAPTPSSSSNHVTRCPFCPAVFTGSIRNRASNLRRHKRTRRHHGSTVIAYSCTVPGCSKTLSRSDNLGKHMRTVHKDIQMQ